MIESALRLWHTVRYLRSVQIYCRAWHSLVKPKPDLAPPPPLRVMATSWHVPAQCTASLTGPQTFLLLNEEGTLAEHGWAGASKSALWRYNQHYFDDLSAIASHQRSQWQRDLIAQWINDNPPGNGIGWDPYPTSLRIVNWIKWALAGHALSEAACHSLAIQARWLMRRLEWHLLGNHLFANAKALVFAGLFFEGSEAAHWLKKGLSILKKQVPEQILSDGAQFELSPMYHALAVEDMLDLVNVTRAFSQDAMADDFSRRVPAMLDWLAAMSHADGGIALFNDAASGVAPSNQQLFDYAIRMGFRLPETPQGCRHLQASGYIRNEAGQGVLIADVAAIGPDYLPGHAHADTLSFEVSIHGQRALVNSGTSLYGTGAERLRQRGTPAHNTVSIEGKNSSDVWAGFRVGRRARVLGLNIASGDGQTRITASHDGYRYLKGHPFHRREWLMRPDGLEIIDQISSRDLEAHARFHVHPGCAVTRDGDGSGRLTLPDGKIAYWRAKGHSLAVEDTTYHPEFGRAVPNKCLVVKLADGACRFTLNWA